MTQSYVYTQSTSFTITHARHLAAKVATDLKRLQRFYGSPSDKVIQDYEGELVELMRSGYLGRVTYGFRRDGRFIEPTVRYSASELAHGGVDDDPGRVRPGADISRASFYSYLTYSSSWDLLTEAQKADFKRRLPVQRGGADEPGVDGYFEGDRTYSAGGRSLARSSVRSVA